MTDIQAALGYTQLQKLDAWLTVRHEIADRYDNVFDSMSIAHLQRFPGSQSALHLYQLHIPNRRKVFNALRKCGIGVNVHYIPVHHHPDFRQLGFRVGDFPNSEHHYDQCISIPMYVGLTCNQQAEVIAGISSALS